MAVCNGNVTCSLEIQISCQTFDIENEAKLVMLNARLASSLNKAHAVAL